MSHSIELYRRGTSGAINGRKREGSEQKVSSSRRGARYDILAASNVEHTCVEVSMGQPCSAVGPVPPAPTYFAALQLANRVSKFGASDSTHVTARNTHCLCSEGND